jgi:hypothetical protein
MPKVFTVQHNIAGLDIAVVSKVEIIYHSGWLKRLTKNIQWVKILSDRK